MLPASSFERVTDMVWRLFTVLAALAAATASHAASAVNLDAEPRIIIVAEGSRTTEILLGGGESAQFCPDGCFVTLPDGSREVLIGTENIEIENGVAQFR